MAQASPVYLRNPTVPGNRSFQFSFTKYAGAGFTVLSATDLALPLSDWTEAGSTTEISPGQYQFADPGATNYPQRFCPVVSP